METRSFRKILIANRGEIAPRVMRSCQAMGVETVAVYSDADADSPHVHFAGEAVHLGAATAQESYLRIDKIIEAARRTGPKRFIPATGFCPRTPSSQKAARRGIVFIGLRPARFGRWG